MILSVGVAKKKRSGGAAGARLDQRDSGRASQRKNPRGVVVLGAAHAWL